MERTKAQRRGHRSVTTRLTQEAKGLMSSLEINQDVVERLTEISQILQDKIKLLQTFDDKIVASCDLEEIENEIMESDEIRTRILDTIKRIKQLKSVHAKSEDESISQEPAVNNTSTAEETIKIRQVRPKLPKISLPRFNGEITKFQAFWDSFQSAINTDPSLSAVDKFNYLKGLLDGPASRAIQGLTLSEANYSSALELIKDRFGNTQKIIATHMDQLLKLTACHTSDKPSQLRYTFDTLSVNIRGLEALGIKADQYGSFLIPILMSKMPNEVQLQIARVSSKDVWELDDILTVIKTEVEARELCESVQTKTAITDKNSHKAYNKPTPTASALLVKDNTYFSPQCVFCDQQHFSSSCPQVTDVQARKKILRQRNRCYLCLRKGHAIETCTSNKTCRQCGNRHQQSICDKLHSKNETATATTASTTNTKVLLQTANAYAVSEIDSNLVPVRLLFDSGSQRTYNTQDIKTKLGLKPIKSESLNLNTFGQDGFTKKRCDLVNIKLQNKHGDEVQLLSLSSPSICSPLSTNFDISQYSHLHHLDLADVPQPNSTQPKPIDILVGADFYWSLINGDVIRGHNGPVAIESFFSWIVAGPVSGTTLDTISTLILSDSPTDDYEQNSNTELINNLQQFWDVESIGILDKSNDNEITSFLREVKFNENQRRYEVQLPWKEDILPDCNNYKLCHSRLLHLQRRLKRNKTLFHEYDNIFKEQIATNIIELVPEEEIDDTETNFMPHHGVIREAKDTTKLRIVFDGSAKTNELSINSCLEKGPNLTPLIFDVLVSFRNHPIGLIADIEKAFHQIIIHPNDCDMLRFLWFKNVHNDEPEIVQYRFRRLVFGLTPSPAILNGVIQHHISQYSPLADDTIAKISKSLYVDDFSSGAVTVEECYNIYTKAKQIFQEGGFNLRKWNSNSNSLIDQINQTEIKHASSTNQTITQSTEPKILGLTWDTTKDEFCFDITEVLDYIKTLKPTKRSILKISAKLFDPLGLLSPFTVKMKMLFQELCQKKTNWDDILESRYEPMWNQLSNEFKTIAKIRVPRCYFSTTQQPINIQLHGFSDASEKAFAGAIYLRSIYDNGDVIIRLIASKTRVSPIKKQSIPRLELLGALILARLMNSVKTILHNKQPIETFYWTDSFTTLCWIKNNKPWKQYIQHRVDEIRNISDKQNWRFCPGTENPSDIPSRSCRAMELLQNKTWWNGPTFLALPPDQWPDLPTTFESEDAHSELVKQPKTIIHSLVAINEAHININTIIDINRFSTLTQLLRVTATVIKYTKLLKRDTTTSQLVADDILQAEAIGIRHVQAKSFPNELTKLQGDGHTSTIYMQQFNLFLDNNQIIRCQGRIANASLPENSKNPILMPPSHALTNLIIQQNHTTVHHNGIRETLNNIREKYWILRGREAVKKYIRRCTTCRKFEGKPYSNPPCPALPIDRVSIDPPYTNTGLDFAGPLFIKSTIDPNQTFKSYVCLFTCQSTRAVHLELTTDLTVQSFLQAFRRFTSTCGLPTRLLSDNATTFRAASKKVTKITRSTEINNYLTNYKISWDNIVEKAPWWGGFWERLVRSIKRCLKKTIGRSSLNFEELRTVLTEIEATLNNRPITYVYDDENGISYSLTPADLIYGRRIATTPSSRQHDISSTNKTLTKRAKYHFKLLDHFSRQWQKEYLTSLLETTTKQSSSYIQTIKVNDIVLLKNENIPRTWWKLAKVVELFQGRDNQVRSAKIQVLQTPNRKPTTLRRPVQHLIPLEVSITK